MSPLPAPSPPSFQNPSSLPLAIIGGGLGGLALAISLLNLGIKPHIYESAAFFSEIGAGVTSGPNAVQAIGLIDDKLLAGYKKHATFNKDCERRDTFLSFRWGKDTDGKGEREKERKAGELMFHLDDVWHSEGAELMGVKTRSSVHRARLLDEMVALLPPNITSFGKTFESAEEQADGSVQLSFADGTTAFASAVIGCDGIKSRVRDIVCGPDIQATYVGEYAFRAMVPVKECESKLGSELACNGQLYCGPGAYIVTYPVDHGAFINMVAIPHERGEKWSWEQADWTVPASSDELLHHFRGWHAPLIALIAKYCQPRKWALFHLQHDAKYWKGKICLLGDAAHATTPHLGAGAGMAMEDAYILSNLIAAVRGSDDVERAFRAFDAVRRPRTQTLIENSRVAGLATDFMMEGVGDDVERLKGRFEEWYRWLWAEDLEVQLERAKGLL
ncbi:mannitol 1-phosphate dehydrogenase [Clohesyomyces aquaticus]|uniref:Mannitol 1-phosphate dehydrogenase n=1 Tax=Clohesyomyces aquaticus TaxID=1231657 RepID=A0A1Y1YT92_9PLEO|nr:mannitol 1-phosphate dehydrogenase [Clohesyomyces aquaticus]